MSVKKLSSDSKSRAPRIPYTQICNHVINNIKNGDAFLVWCYLVSKTEKWVVIKEHLKKRFGFGNSKLKKIFSYLNRSGLLKYCATHCANGDFAHWDIAIQDGAHFDAQVTYKYENKEEKQCAAVGQKSTQCKMHPVDNGLLLNKDKTTKQKEDHKNSCASDDARMSDELSLFTVFWMLYPKKKDKIRAAKVWKSKKLEEQGEEIIDALKLITKGEWSHREKQYIPDPSGWLSRERWKDEIIDQKNINKSGRKETGAERALRLCTH